MAGGGVVGGKEDSGREPQLYILALPTVAPPAVLVSRLVAAVPRKARTRLPRAVPSAWWSGKISFLPPPPAQDPAKEEEGRRFPRPQRVRVAPSLDLGIAAVGREKPKRLRRCLHCGKKEMGRGTLCNVCSKKEMAVVLERRPAASPVVDSPLENPIWEPEVPGAIYLVRKSAAERRPHTPRTEAVPAPRPATRCLQCGSSEQPLWIEGPTGRREVCAACGMRYKKGRLLPECPPPARPITNSSPESRIWELEAPPHSVHLPRKIPPHSVHLPKKKISKKNKKKKHKGPAPWPKDKGKTCLHCGTSQTPQWREGPKGRGTLCNACGVRYKQGGLLPEYRPAASPTFMPSEHANMRRKVLQLHRNRRGMSPPAPVDRVTKLLPIRGDRPAVTASHAGEDPAHAPGCTDKPIDVPSSLDSLLLDGPSAPLIVESEDFLIS